MAYIDNTGVEYLVGDIKDKADATYQPILTSGTNIKTINNTSLLGSGDISVGGTTTWYGTCSTTASTAAKAVTCSGYAKEKGAIIGVLFSTANTAAAPTLNINSTGAAAIYVGSAVASATNFCKWAANNVVYFMYDGTYYRYICQSPGSYKTYYATCATSAGTAAKVATTTNGDFVKTTGAMVRIKMTSGNSYNGTATLNVDGTGASNIARVGTTTTDRYYWVSGEVIDFVYDGTNFVMSAKGTATTTYYGLTKLSSSATSTSEALALTPKAMNSIAGTLITNIPAYSSSETYAVGDRVRYSYGIYKCNTAITTAESWTEAHWTAEKSLLEMVEDKQDTLVSGTNIKTINSTSLLGSGNISIPALPSVTSSDNDKVLTVVSGAWAAAAASGGVSITYATVNIATSDWSNGSCTKTVSGVTANSGIIVTYAPASKDVYTAADVYCSAQAANSLTFNCSTTPTAAVAVNVMIIEGGG